MKPKHIALIFIVVFLITIFAFGKVQIEAERYGESLEKQSEIHKELLENLETNNLILESEISDLRLEYKELELKNKALELEAYSCWIGRNAE